MTYNAGNRGAATDIPVNIRLTPAERARLLGQRGEELLALALDAIKDLAAQEGWPLRLIDVLRWQSQEEPDDEYVDVVPEIGPTGLSWDDLFNSLIGCIFHLGQSLSEADREFFHDIIHYGVRVKN